MGKDYYKLLAQNKKASFEYFLEQFYEVGIELKGTEVKSVRQGKVSIKESYVQINKGQVYIFGMHISPYEQGNIFNVDPIRTRRLLMHRQEIRKLIGLVQQKGYTLVPVRVYVRGNYVKMEIALAKGKKIYDKRQSIAEKDQKRDMERNYKNQ